MTFDEVLEAVEGLLREHGRVTYRGLRRRFDLDEEYLEDVRAELITARRVARDEDGAVLVHRTPDEVETVGGLTSRLLHGQGAQAERRQLTVVFCDLTGSTALSGRLDPEEWREVLRSYHEVCSDAVRAYEGHIAQYLGDGVLIYFGYPVAHEDDAVRSVHAGLAIIEAIGGLGRRLDVACGELAVRVGIHTGLVVVGEMGAGADRKEQLALGETPNVAARIQSQASPQQLVVSDATRRLLGRSFRLDDLGPCELRGVDGATRLFAVEGAVRSGGSERAGSTLVSLIGRTEEVAILDARFARAGDGAGQLVSITADAGLGKSHLVQVLRARLQGRPHVFWEWRCSSYHQGSALHPVVAFLRRLLNLDAADAPEHQLQRVEAGLREHGLGGLRTPEHLADLAALLGLPPPSTDPGGPAPAKVSAQQRKRRTLQLLLSILTTSAAQLPVCLAIEDLHWADPSTRELLELLLQQLPEHRILIIVTLRPKSDAPAAASGHTTALSLSPLGRSEVETLASAVAEGRALPAALIDQLAAITDGVPLFVEELTTMVLEAGLLERQGDAYVLRRPISSLGIPSTLQGSLMARLDHLSSVKSVAQLASVLGREFTLPLLVAVAELPDQDVAHELQRLVSADVLRQRGSAARGSFVFRHALIQEAAYQSLLKSSRQHYHSRVAAALGAGVCGDPAQQPEQLALHHEAAGELPEAIEYLYRAGVRAAESSALAEAVGHLTHALSLLRGEPASAARNREELRLRLALGAPLIATRGYASRDVAEGYARIRALCGDAGDPAALFRGLWGLFLSSAVRAEFAAAAELAGVLQQAAERSGDVGLRVETHFVHAHAFWTGDLAGAKAHCEQGLAAFDAAAHADHAYKFGQDPEVGLASYLSWILWLMGEQAEARAMCERALSRARATGHTHSLGFALAFAGVFEQMAGDLDATLALADELIEHSTAHDHPTWLADGDMLRGWALARRGDPEGLSQLQRGLDAWDALGARLWRTHQLVLLADACLTLGDLPGAQRALCESAEVSAETGEVYYNAEAERLRAKVLLQVGEPDAREMAREHLAQGIGLAEANGAHGLRRRIASELDRV